MSAGNARIASKSKTCSRSKVSVSSTLSNRSAYRPPSTHLRRRAASARGSRFATVKRRRCARWSDVEVLDRLVHLAVLRVAQPIAVLALEQDSNEGVQEVQMLGRRLERERVDRDRALPQAQFHVSAVAEASPASDSCGRDRGRS